MIFGRVTKLYIAVSETSWSNHTNTEFSKCAGTQIKKKEAEFDCVLNVVLIKHIAKEVKKSNNRKYMNSIILVLLGQIRDCCSRV